MLSQKSPSDSEFISNYVQKAEFGYSSSACLAKRHIPGEASFPHGTRRSLPSLTQLGQMLLGSLWTPPNFLPRGIKVGHLTNHSVHIWTRELEGLSAAHEPLLASVNRHDSTCHTVPPPVSPVDLRRENTPRASTVDHSGACYIVTASIASM